MAHTAFWDSLAERYAKQAISDESAYAATLDRVRHWLGSDAHVLEIGCGTGTTAITLAPCVAHLVATDASKEMIRIGKAKADAAGATNLTFDVALSDAAGAEHSFDAVMAFNLLHLVDDVPSTLQAMRNRLSKGGLLLTKTPCLRGKPWFRPLVGAMQLIGKAPRPVHYLSPKTLGQAIRTAGFEILETGDYPKKLPNHFVVARAI